MPGSTLRTPNPRRSLVPSPLTFPANLLRPQVVESIKFYSLCGSCAYLHGNCGLPVTFHRAIDL